MSGPGRNPYAHVKRALRREVGFQCPVRECGNPYLTWHHFDPPWRDEHHHRIEGMIALCAEHANKADNGAFTDDQLRQLKVKTPERDVVGGRFDWRRQEFLVRLGGNFYYRQNNVLQLGTELCTWLGRDEEGMLEVNFRMPSLAGEPRARVLENFWTAHRTADEIVSPPMGRKIEVKYNNGDHFKILFRNVKEPHHISVLYPAANAEQTADVVTFPTTIVEITAKVAGTSLEFSPNHTATGGPTMTECLSTGNAEAGLCIDLPQSDVEQLFPPELSE